MYTVEKKTSHSYRNLTPVSEQNTKIVPASLLKSRKRNISREDCNIVRTLAGQNRCRTEGTRKKGKMTYELQEKNSLKVFYANCRNILNEIDLFRGLVSV